MTDLAAKYALPPELIDFVQDGLLELLREIEPEQTVEFHIPSMLWTDSDLRATSYTLTWIHPDFNAAFCHFYADNPGDLPNFHITADTDDFGDEVIPDLDSIDDLACWLAEARDARLQLQ